MTDFEAYFNVADELTDPITSLGDLDAGWVAKARRAADDAGLSWPPDLADAEEHAHELAWRRAEWAEAERDQQHLWNTR